MRSIILALVVTSLTACTVPSGEVDQQDDLSSESQALERFTWSQGQPPLTLKPTSEWICVLSEARGKFEGDKEWVRVIERSGFWILEGASNQSGVGARASCFRKTDFQTGSIGWSAPAQDLYVSWNSCPPLLACGGFPDEPRGSGCRSARGLLWNGDSTAILNGIGGRFDGLSQISEVRQSTDHSITSDVSVTTCRDGREKGIRGVAIAATSSPGTIARYIGPGDAAVVAADAEFSLNGTGTVTMARSDRAMCHITHVSGSLRSSTDRVAIEQRSVDGVLRQVLVVSSAAPVHAKARCYALDQRWFNFPVFPLPFPLPLGT